MKISLLLISLVTLSPINVEAQDGDSRITNTINTIKKNIQCCSVPFSKNSTTKATTILIFKNGDATIVYNNNKLPASFNLFTLYRTEKIPLGFGLNAGKKIIFFQLSESLGEAIKFNTVKKTQETFELLNKLLKDCVIDN